MVRITPSLAIRESELSFSFTTSQGPGGQNVNKVATRAVLRFDVAHSPSLDDVQRAQIRHALAPRINNDGILQVSCSRGRSQEANRRGALDVFRSLIAAALGPRKKRKATRPTRNAVERRLVAKAARSRQKQQRRRVHEAD
jgi:ribosome-associated protein